MNFIWNNKKIISFTFLLILLNTFATLAERPLIAYWVLKPVLTSTITICLTVSFILIWLLFVLLTKRSIYLTIGLIYISITMTADLLIRGGYFYPRIFTILLDISAFFISPINIFSYIIVVNKFLDYNSQFYFRTLILLSIFLALSIKLINSTKHTIGYYPLIFTIILTYLNLSITKVAVYESFIEIFSVPLISVATFSIWLISICYYRNTLKILLIYLKFVASALFFQGFSLFFYDNKIFNPLANFIIHTNKFIFHLFYFPDIYKDSIPYEFILYFGFYNLILFFTLNKRLKVFNSTI